MDKVLKPYKKGRTVEELGSELGVAPSALALYIKLETGEFPPYTVKDLRLGRAAKNSSGATLSEEEGWFSHLDSPKGRQLKAGREFLDVSQQNVASLAILSRQMVSEAEREKRRNPFMLSRIALALLQLSRQLGLEDELREVMERPRK